MQVSQVKTETQTSKLKPSSLMQFVLIVVKYYELLANVGVRGEKEIKMKIVSKL